MNPYLSIVTPVFNEEKRIENCLKNLGQYLEGRDFTYEVILVNDGSRDRSVAIIKALIAGRNNFRLLDNRENHGKGYAVKQGVIEAQGQYILFTDADLSTPIRELEKLLPFISDYPVVIGSRYLSRNSIKIQQPLLRRAISRCGNLMIKIFLGLDFSDTQCGFKLFQAQAAKDIFRRIAIDRWGFDIELLAIAKGLKYPIKEVAVSWYDNPDSQLRAGKAALATFKELLKIKSNLGRDVYKLAKSKELFHS